MRQAGRLTGFNVAASKTVCATVSTVSMTRTGSGRNLAALFGLSFPAYPFGLDIGLAVDVALHLPLGAAAVFMDLGGWSEAQDIGPADLGVELRSLAGENRPVKLLLYSPGQPFVRPLMI